MIARSILALAIGLIPAVAAVAWIAAIAAIAGIVLVCLGAAAWRGGATLSAHPRISTSLTWHADIQPLFARHCTSCHADRGTDRGTERGTESGTASVPLDTFAAARPWARAIREEVLERRMPLPRGRPGVDAGVDDHPLSTMERDLIVAWIDGGAPEGRPGAPAAATFWCVMHPEIRADRAGACPLCGMTLSAFTPDLTRRYGWSVSPAAIATATASPRRGRPVPLTFSITEQTAGVRVDRLERVHEHPLHLFIVSEDFRSFEHVHPEQTTRAAPHPTLSPQAGRGDDDGSWTIAWRPPAPGRYWFYGDFLPTGGPPQMLQRTTVVGTPSARVRASGPRTARVDRDMLVATTGRVRGTLTVPTLPTMPARLVAGLDYRLLISLQDATTSSPIADLQPYLGAWGHLFVLHEQRDEALHAHPDSAATTAGGPAIAFDVLFPRAGTYYLWGQFKRRGEIITLPFVIQVGPRAWMR